MRKDEVIENICGSLKENGYIDDYKYDHFKQGGAIAPPYAVYRRVAPQNFSADGIVYHRGNNVDFELYASDPDEMADLMEQAESLMTGAGLYYVIAADTVYIESEDFYETLYEL